MRLVLPDLALANRLYAFAMARGLENLGTQVRYKAPERMSGGGVNP